MPVVEGPNPAARPFKFKGDKASRARALECLTSTIYYEAGQESTDGQRYWTTVGCSTDIIEASWLALSDALEYALRGE